MLPLAMILKGLGHTVSGSDRSRDQGRTPEKFENLEHDGFDLFPQDGSGLQGEQSDVTSPVCMAGEFNRPDFLVVSAAVEDTVPDVVAAKACGIPIIKRAALLAELFNGFERRIAVGGTSGKTTTTGMIGYIAEKAELEPTVMCGGVMKNFGATALVGKGNVFVTEADESDGSIAQYNPEIAILNNVSVDHKELDELRQLFGDFVGKARVAIINADNAEAMALAGPNAVTYGLNGGDFHATDIFPFEDGVSAVVSHGKERAAISLEVPGLHNLSNALAAIAAMYALGVPLSESCAALGSFTGIKRRMEWVGEARGITVMDDFAHNPDKIAATLSALKQFDGRLLIVFQMHGYGPLKLMWKDLAASFADHLGPDDRVFMPDPLYLGGTVDRSIGSKQVVAEIGNRAEWAENREIAGARAVAMAQPGDRIIVMGARDDTLSDFAQNILNSLKNQGIANHSQVNQ